MPISKPIIKISAFVVITAASSTLALFVMKDKISAEVNQISQRRNMVISLDKRESNFVNLKKDYAIVSDGLPKARSLFPGIDDMDDLIDRIDKLSLELGGSNTIKFDNNPESFSANTNKLNFTIVFSGKKEFFSKFTDRFSKLPYLTKINRIEIRNSQNSEAAPDLMTIGASVFLKK